MDGLVKDRTQCAPNGYYFIPVYDRVWFTVSISMAKSFLCSMMGVFLFVIFFSVIG